jgi:cell division protein FtsQ
MPKSGTTQSAILKRRRRSGKTARLSAFVRRLTVPAMIVVAVMVLGVWLVLSGLPGRVALGVQHQFYRATAHAGFAVDNMLVEGRINADPDILRGIIDMQRGESIFAFHPRDAKAQLEKVSWIKQARVERRLPDTIYIALTERTPAALWQNKGHLAVIDADGVILADSNLGKFRDLMLVVGEDAPAHMSDLNELLHDAPTLSDRVQAATLVGGRRWDLQLKNGITVRLPETDPSTALQRLAKAQSQDQLLDKNLTSVDLRNGDRIIVATKPDADADTKTAPGKNI